MNKLSITILFLVIFDTVGFGQLYVGDNALMHISNGANIRIGEDLENNGAIQNLGKMTLYKNWSLNDNFNGVEGTIEFKGMDDQLVNVNEAEFRELIINSLGEVLFPGNEYTVIDRIQFKMGTVNTGPNTRFILGEDASVIDGSNSSYFAGSIISKGSGFKVFPVGENGIYAPLTLTNVNGFANETEIQVAYKRGIPVDPEPGDSLLGVSYRGYWELELVNGSTEATPVQLQFNEEDLTDFKIFNNIRFRASTPAVAFTESIVNRWQSLFVSELIDTDSTTFGTITSEIPFEPTLGQKTYFAVALAPTVPENLRPYIPEIFSPNANDPDNKAFKIFGQNISEENFSLQIYNKLGIRVYSTTSFKEANEFGWDGTNPSGGDEPTGIYYYSVRLTFGRDRDFSKSGTFFLLR